MIPDGRIAQSAAPRGMLLDQSFSRESPSLAEEVFVIVPGEAGNIYASAVRADYPRVALCQARQIESASLNHSTLVLRSFVHLAHSQTSTQTAF